MNEYSFTVRNVYHYYGYPELEDHYEITNTWFKCNVRYYGNHGFDIPQFTNNARKTNGYFWSMHALLGAMYDKNGTLRSILRGLGENETKTITLTL